MAVYAVSAVCAACAVYAVYTAYAVCAVCAANASHSSLLTHFESAVFFLKLQHHSLGQIYWLQLTEQGTPREADQQTHLLKSGC